ncbi:DUF711 family protein [Thermofilum pendens]|uniref:DUF711 family protein n=1 Tax=Thermofilum pendens (strain DSM 2475 / Hrk 5) TaxID=368408 RepID=A1RXB6_THEPD|nr:DUF711 family protein [Thermofilum pendens]ABL77846.1 protein of unknown function DUF711 [Thermofilum pendens Hrk 5]
MRRSAGFKVRAVVLHVDLEKGGDSLEEKLAAFTEAVKAFSETTGVDVWTKRVVANPVPPESFEKAVHALYSAAEPSGINYVAVPQRRPLTPEVLADVMDSYERLYSSATYDDNSTATLVSTVKALSERSPLMAARYAVSFGGFIQTPYFPATATSVEGVSLSLLYPKFLSENPLSKVSETFSGLAARAEKTLPGFLGIDFSLSPWEDESVALLVEKVSGTTLGSPGTIRAIRELNRRINLLAHEARAVGYNEVMLPLAEDNRLKELAKTGQLRFSHLLNYASYCVAGLDMVVIPDTTEDKVLENILLDLSEIQKLKGRILGLRLILAPAEEGDEVEVGFFGKIPVISPLD